MAESCPKHDDKGHQEMSQNAKDNVQETGNLEAHEVLMITDAVQCGSRFNHATLGHNIANVDLFLLEQVKKLRNKFSRKSSFVLMFSYRAHLFSKLECPEGKQMVAARTLGGTTNRVTFTKSATTNNHFKTFSSDI